MSTQIHPSAETAESSRSWTNCTLPNSTLQNCTLQNSNNQAGHDAAAERAASTCRLLGMLGIAPDACMHSAAAALAKRMASR